MNYYWVWNDGCERKLFHGANPKYLYDDYEFIENLELVESRDLLNYLKSLSANPILDAVAEKLYYTLEKTSLTKRQEIFRLIVESGGLL